MNAETKTEQSPELRRDLFRNAVKTGNFPLMQSLLERGGLGSPPPLGSEALQLAASAGKAPTVSLLLHAGVDPSPELRRAVTQGNLRALEVLLDAGASAAAADDHSVSLLHTAVQFGHENIALRLLQAGLPVNGRTTYNCTPLHFSVGSNASAPLISTLIEHGAEIDARDESGATAAMNAAARGHIAVFAHLVNMGADPMAQDYHGKNAFDLALIQTQDSRVLELLECYPALAPTGEALDAAFVTAVRQGSAAKAQMFADMGADLGQKPDGRTLFQCAPRDAVALKRLLRSLKTGAAIGSAMGEQSSLTATESRLAFPSL